MLSNVLVYEPVEHVDVFCELWTRFELYFFKSIHSMNCFIEKDLIDRKGHKGQDTCVLMKVLLIKI